MVHQRVSKMKQKGYLKGVEVVLDERKMGYEWSAFTGIELKEDSDSKAIIAALEQALAKIA